MKIVFHAAIWLVVLIGGIEVVGTVFGRTSQGGTGNGAGFFDYSFQSLFFPSVEGDPSISDIELEGRAPRRFKVYGGVSPVYDQISMTWSLNPGYEGRPEGRLLFDLDSDTIVDRDVRVPLDIEYLLAALEIPDRHANRLTLQYVLDVLEDCHTGQLPRPSHHGYTLQDPMSGGMRHVALGFMMSYSILTWVGIWILAITVFYTTKGIITKGAAKSER
jgi:hypothetical protein